MSKIDYFTVILQKDPPTYLTGETIEGQLIIKVNKRFKINSLKCSLRGYAYVHW